MLSELVREAQAQTPVINIQIISRVLIPPELFRRVSIDRSGAVDSNGLSRVWLPPAPGLQ